MGEMLEGWMGKGGYGGLNTYDHLAALNIYSIAQRKHLGVFI